MRKKTARFHPIKPYKKHSKLELKITLNMLEHVLSFYFFFSAHVRHWIGPVGTAAKWVRVRVISIETYRRQNGGNLKFMALFSFRGDKAVTKQIRFLPWRQFFTSSLRRSELCSYIQEQVATQCVVFYIIYSLIS